MSRGTAPMVLAHALATCAADGPPHGDPLIMDGAGVRVVNPAPRAATTLGWRLADGSTVWIGEHPATDTSWSRSATAPRPSRAWCSACNGISPSRPAGWRWPRGTRTAPASTTRPADEIGRAHV